MKLRGRTPPAQDDRSGFLTSVAARIAVQSLTMTICREIDILDPEAQCLEQPQPPAIENRRDQPRGSFHRSEERADFTPYQDDGQTLAGRAHSARPPYSLSRSTRMRPKSSTTMKFLR